MTGLSPGSSTAKSLTIKEIFINFNIILTKNSCLKIIWCFKGTCPQSLPDKVKVFNELTVLKEEGLPCLEVLVKVSVGWIISEINQFDKTSFLWWSVYKDYANSFASI